MQYKIFETLQEYNDYTSNGQKLIAGVLYLVNETGSLFFKTNNVDGVVESFDYVDGIPEGYVKPVGDKLITENEYYVDVYNYATVSVDVPEPEGNITITENGTDIDVAAYATATVDVAGGGGGIADPILAYPSASQTTGSGELSKTSILQLATALNIPNGYTSIGHAAFEGYLGLTSLTLPDTLTSIGAHAFRDCTGLTSLTLPDSVDTIGDSAFSDCSGLTSLSLPNTLTSIGGGAFWGCSGLTSLTIPDSVDSIGGGAFWGCSGLTDVTIGIGVAFIGGGAFGGCSALTSLTINTDTPPELEDDIFEGEIPEDLVIYVPAESVSAYQSASGWSEYADRIQAIEE